MVTSRVWFTAEQKVKLRERWKRGQTISSISRALERRTKGCVQQIVSVHGGIAPSARRKAAWTLELREREEIFRGIAAGLALRAIARSLARSPSTICREIARNGGAQTYRATRADKQAWERALRPKRCRLACSEQLRWLVAQKLALEWSPDPRLAGSTRCRRSEAQSATSKNSGLRDSGR